MKTPKEVECQILLAENELTSIRTDHLAESGHPLIAMCIGRARLALDKAILFINDSKARLSPDVQNTKDHNEKTVDR
jgi:hypothetical protein